MMFARCASALVTGWIHDPGWSQTFVVMDVQWYDTAVLHSQLP